VEKRNISVFLFLFLRSGRGLFCKIEEGNETENKLPFGEKKMIMVVSCLKMTVWGNSGNSVRVYFFGLQNHCRW